MLISNFAKPKVRPGARKYHCNEWYFEHLDTERAYWLGFIVADGCVSLRWPHGKNKKPQFIFSVSSKDYEHLEKLQAALRTDHPICGPHKGCYQLIFSSYPLCLDLERFGVVPAKSYTVQMPRVPKELRSHLFRGVFDGDGSFGLSYRPPRIKKNNGRGRPPTQGRYVLVFSIVGSYAICRAFHKQFGGAWPRQKAGVWTYCTSGWRAKKALQWMYTDQKPSLNRKNALAVSLGILKA